MPALATDTIPRMRAGGGSRYNTGKAAANAVIFNGALIAKNATGFIVAASDAAAIKVVGIATVAANNTGGADGALDVQYITAIEVELNNAAGAIVQASFGTLCCVADDNSVTTAAVAANDVLAGLVRSFTATKVWVFVDEVIGQTG